jgi:phosphoheptose isomerase
VIPLTADTCTLTAWANDYGYEYIFSRQVEAYGTPGDVLIVLSTSGNSQNVIHALASASEQGLYTIGLLGETGGKALTLCDIPICVPCRNTACIQELHIQILHIVCQLVEQKLLLYWKHQTILAPNGKTDIGVQPVIQEISS